MDNTKDHRGDSAVHYSYSYKMKESCPIIFLISINRPISIKSKNCFSSILINSENIMENGEVNTIAHFSLELDIPSSTEVTMYTALNKKKDKKNKEKYNKFTYYKV